VCHHARERVETPGDEIRVLIVDDHPGLRAELKALLTTEVEIAAVAAPATSVEAWRDAEAARSNVVVLDPDSGLADGLRLCFELKNRVGGPSVVIYSAYADRLLAAPAKIAQADALVSKTAPVSELLDAIRLAASGGATGPAVASDALLAVSARLLEEDLPVMQKLLSRTPLRAIADDLRLDEREVRDRALRIIERFEPSGGRRA